MSWEDWTDLEWAARCLHASQNEAWTVDTLSDASVVTKERMIALAHHARAHGYVPPPRPTSVREQIVSRIVAYSQRGGHCRFVTAEDALGLAAVLLERFNITPKEVQP
jgi:hypothetical protein